MRILIVSQFFDPEPTLKGLGFAKALAADGHEVEILTGFPNYPGGNIYPGYRVRLHQEEEIDGIRIHRVALYPSHDRSALRRIWNYLSFALSASVVGPLFVKRPDVLYVYHPPLTISLPAVTLKILMRCPIVLDIQDLWPDTLKATGMVSKPWMLAFVGRWATWFYRNADQIAVLSPGFRDRLIERGVPAEKVSVVYNWNDESRQSARQPDWDFAAKWGLKERFNVLFAGSMGRAQSLETVLNAARICQTTCPNAQFVMIGGGSESFALQKRAKEERLENVRFIPAQPMAAMGGILPLAEVLLVHLKDDPLFTITIPSKTQAYLANGRPILMAMRGDAADLIERADAGLIVPPEDPAAMAAAVRELYAMPAEARLEMGRRGREFYDAELSMSVGVKKFETLFAVAPARGRPVGFYRRFGKRTFDFLVTSVILTLIWPVLLVLCVLGYFNFDKRIFFKQRRAGRRGRLFDIYKFRSMTEARDAAGDLLPDAQRIPAYGAFLRRSSLDELPGLLNVLRGEMSLVGPRPLLPDYLPYYSSRHARRHDVRPGITGPAQINGRQLARFSERMEMDVWYVDHCSFGTDLKILLLTIPRVLGSRGVVVGQEVAEVDDLGLSRGLKGVSSGPSASVL